MFEGEEDWLELHAHVRCTEKQLWKWKYHKVEAPFRRVFSEDTSLDYEDDDSYNFPYASERTSVKLMT